MQARTREARILIWRGIRCYRRFSIPQLSRELKLPYDTVQRYVALLTRNDYLERVESYDPEAQNEGIYEITRDTGVYPPAVRKGKFIDPNLQPDQAESRAKAWQVCRKLRQVDVHGLASIAGMSSKSAQKFLKALADEGYLRLDTPNVSGRAGSWNVYQVANDTGPYPLLVRRDGTVFDPNTYPLKGA
jgi:hypothetical protein